MSSRVPDVSSFKIPDYKYVAPRMWGKYDAVTQIARLRLLQACERLGIAITSEQAQAVDLRAIPGEENASVTGWAFSLPTFSLMYQSEAEWKKEAKRQFEEQCKCFLTFVRESLAQQVAAGGLARVRQGRSGKTVATLDLRYEWAAQRYFMKRAYKDIARGNHNAGQVRQAVLEILKEAALPLQN